MVARCEVDHTGTDLLDDSCSLVAKDDGERRRMDALRDMQVRVADAARRHTDGQLACLRRIELELLDDERLPERMEDGRTKHYRPPSTTSRSSSAPARATVATTAPE